MISLILKIEMKVTIIAVGSPNKIKEASEIPKFTDTLPVFGSGTDRFSAANMSKQKSTTPNIDIFSY